MIIINVESKLRLRIIYQIVFTWYATFDTQLSFVEVFHHVCTLLRSTLQMMHVVARIYTE